MSKVKPITSQQRNIINSLGFIIALSKVEGDLKELHENAPELVKNHLENYPKDKQIHNAFMRAVNKSCKSIQQQLLNQLEGKV